MKQIIFPFVMLTLISCSDNSQKISELQTSVSELQKKVDDSYKPGFGEFMSDVQIHHAKLWFAGINQIWKLAQFEIDELKEIFEDIKKYQYGREETKALPIIEAPLDSVESSVKIHSPELFRKNFIELTNTCNECHQAVHYEFNKVKIPDSPPFSNQDFVK